MPTKNLGRVVGKSAYEIAVANGYKGTEKQWLESLMGGGKEAIESVNGKKGKQITLGAGDIKNKAGTSLETHSMQVVMHTWGSDTKNEGNDYSVSVTSNPTYYVNRMGIIMTCLEDSTDAITLNVNELGKKPVIYANGTPVTDIKKGGVYEVRYNEDNKKFILIGGSGGGSEEQEIHNRQVVLHTWGSDTTNDGNDYACTVTSNPTYYVNRMGIIITCLADSNGATTLNVNGLGKRAILNADGTPKVDLKENGIYTLRFNDNTKSFIVQGEGSALDVDNTTNTADLKKFRVSVLNIISR